MARHIDSRGRITWAAAQANRKTEQKIQQKKICEACGREFSEKVVRDSTDSTLCTECKASLD